MVSCFQKKYFHVLSGGGGGEGGGKGGGEGGEAKVLGEIYGASCSTWGTNNQIMARMWGV